MFGDMPDENWEHLILDADPPLSSAGSCAVGDVDGDGRAEMIVGGNGALLWYRPTTFERGVIAEGQFQVGLVVQDVDGDGRPEVVSSFGGETTGVAWFKPKGRIQGEWERHDVVTGHPGSPHDILFADFDGDGVEELLAIAAYSSTPGIHIYKPGAEPTGPWERHTAHEGYFADGTCVADLDGDGLLEIACGPAWYHAPEGGPLAGPWERRVFAPAFREMCRTAPLDVTGNGVPDLVIAEAEFLDGRLSWFENRLAEDPENRWVEHVLGDDLQYAHTLHAWRKQGRAHFFVAEMAAGGWVDFYNYDARLLQFSTEDGGRNWSRKVLARGTGSHEACPYDLDDDGEWEIAGKEWKRPRVHVFKRRCEPSPLQRFRHRMLDRDKPHTATDIMAFDVDGDGRDDVVCGAWWYRNPDWRRFPIPGIYQAHCAYDVDGDGRCELIATREKDGAESWYEGLSSELCWLRPVDPVNGVWDEFPIGVGDGDWPHGSTVAPLLDGGPLALVVGYHSAGHGDRPQVFQIPDDPTDGPWPKSTLADIQYGEEIVPWDITGDGALDLVAGPWWLENQGGGFTPHRIAEDFDVARLRVADVNGDGRPDVVLGEEVLDFENKETPFSRVAWFECPEDPREGDWRRHVIDRVRCPHSLDVADLDGDGELEVIVGEHDPFMPYRKRCCLFVYKKADPAGEAWKRYLVDARFEHHDGAQVIHLGGGRKGIVSHGWTDSRYVHLWEPTEI